MILNLIIKYFRSLIATDQQDSNLALFCLDGINISDTSLSINGRQILSKNSHYISFLNDLNTTLSFCYESNTKLMHN